MRKKVPTASDCVLDVCGELTSSCLSREMIGSDLQKARTTKKTVRMTTTTRGTRTKITRRRRRRSKHSGKKRQEAKRSDNKQQKNERQ